MEKRVLFVDDEPPMLKILANLARSNGYTPSCATNGPEALEIIERDRIRVCFLDLRMPGMSGMELCKLIKEQDHDAHVFALSAFANAYKSDQYLAAGFDDHFTKPFKIAEIFGACAKAFEQMAQQNGAPPVDG